MKKLFVLYLICFWHAPTFAQAKTNPDSLAYQQQRAQTKSAQAENYSLAYMTTINRLRDQIERIKQDALTAKQEQENKLRTYVILFVLMLGSILFLLFTKRRAKA